MVTHTTITEAILSTAISRGNEKSTCPSEIARKLFPADWRNHMGEVRDAAITLQKEGKVVITQHGQPIDTKHIRGPVRIKIAERV